MREMEKEESKGNWGRDTNKERPREREKLIKYFLYGRILG